MTRFNLWMAPLIALAMAIGVATHPAVAQQNDKKQADSSSKSSDSSAAKEQSSSQSSSQPSNNTSSNSGSNQKSDSSADSNKQSSSQSSNSQANSSQSSSNSNKAADQGSSANQSQQGQSQSNQRAQSDNRANQSSNAQGQAGADNRSNSDARSNAAQSNQSNQNNQANRNNQSDNRDNRSRDNNNRQTNINVGIQFGAVNDRGLVINTVQQNSFFYRAGLRQGDILVSIGGQPIRNQAVFIEYVTAHPGDRIPVIVLRDGRQETVYIVYEEDNLVPPAQPGIGGDAAIELLGVTLDAQIPNAAVVREVFPGGPAAQAGLKQGDEIIGINNQRVNGLQSVHQFVGTLKQGDRVEIDYLQLKHAQITLGNSSRTATATGVGVNQGVQQSNYQADAQIQGNQPQNQNRPAASSQQNSRNANQNSGNRSIVPRIRN